MTTHDDDASSLFVAFNPVEESLIGEHEATFDLVIDPDASTQGGFSFGGIGRAG